MSLNNTLDTRRTTALSPAEVDDLARCEAIIEPGLKTFYEVGSALLAIRDQRLYRQTHTTFDAYTRDRWGMSKPYATQWIGASKVVSNLVAMATIPLPSNERQVRPLTDLSPDQQREAWATANERTGGHPTAKVVREVVAERWPKPRRVGVRIRPASPTPAPETSPVDRVAPPVVEAGLEIEVGPPPAVSEVEVGPPPPVSEVEVGPPPLVSQQLEATVDDWWRGLEALAPAIVAGGHFPEVVRRLDPRVRSRILDRIARLREVWGSWIKTLEGTEARESEVSTRESQVSRRTARNPEECISW